MAYIGNSPGVASQRIVTSFTATSGQTLFTLSSGYTLGYLDVYVNGVKQIDGSDYTASNGTSVTLTQPTIAGDVVECIAYIPRGLSDGYLKTEADSRFSLVTDSAATANGVVYRNSSKVLTTGSALTFDGTNLGLGVTPSAWSSGYKAIQLGARGSLYAHSSVGATLLGENLYDNGTNAVYIATAAAGRYQISAGVHSWSTAPSGTAGNAISFTQAMTLDASNDFLLGTTSTTRFVSSLETTFTLRGNSSGKAASLSLVSASANCTGGIGAGDSTPAIYVGTTNSTPLVLQTNNTERARIDSSGNLLVGTTSGSWHTIRKDATDAYGLAVVNGTTGNPYGLQISYPNRTPNTVNELFVSCVDSTTARMQVRSNGGIANYSANNVNLSDRREKTNFAPAGDYLSKICAIPVQTFNYIDQNTEEDPGLTLGVVAQDVQAVAPELVMESNWGTQEEPKMRLSIYQTDLQYALMKCIQEQQAIIEQLKADVAALKAAA